VTHVDDRTGPVDVVLLGDVAAWSVPLDLDGLRAPGPTCSSAVRIEPGSWLAVASVQGRIVGFAKARPVAAAFPADHPRAPALRELGADRRDAWLADALEIVELVTTPHASRERVARSLVGVIVTPARRRKVWTVVEGHDLVGRRVFETLGWVRVGSAQHGAGPVALLAPEHPAVRDGSARRQPAAPAVPARWAQWTAPGRDPAPSVDLAS
jgi:hypothetical protein